MANYTTNTSDKSKDKAIKLLLCGGIGLHYFYVGRIKAGIAHLIIGLFIWMAIIASIIDPELHEAIIPAIIFIIILNVPDFIRLKLGKFRDNIGNALRQ